MRVLITNNTLGARAGTELYVRDLAIELMRRGHQPVAYSTHLGIVAEELRAATVPVIDSLKSLGEPPDIIHGQHHYEALTALLRFPSAPAVYCCHGWLPFEETTLRHPNILRYIAVDELCREKLITEGGIQPERIELIFNFYDQRLFAPRTPLPPKPKRALAFSNEFTEHSGLQVLSEACARCGIELHVHGLANGNPIDQPGRFLAAYDVVFAKARCAIEALAVGTAVILCAPGRLGHMVTSKDFAALRTWNFGIRTLTQPLQVDLVTAELQKYDCADAAQVSQLTRGACEMHAAVDRILDVYHGVIRENSESGPRDRLEAGSAAVQYLEYWAARYKHHFILTADRDRWIERCNAAERVLRERDDQIREMGLIGQDGQRWIERCNAAETALAEREGQLDEISRVATESRRALDEIEKQREHWAARCSAAESALAHQQRLLREAEQQALHTRNLLSERDTELVRLAQELAGVRFSATWRWTQSVLQSSPVQMLFGSLIRSVVDRHKPARVANLQQRADQMIAERGFLGVARETFSQAGREQLIALLLEGLRPESRVLEFGCGCLRIAYWLVGFLDADRYFGIEPARQRVDYGLHYLFTPEEIQLKRPRFDFNSMFDSSVFNTRFDFFLARSIWTHASKPQIEATLDSFLRDAAPTATFLASYLPAESDRDDYRGLEWVGTSHESDKPGVIRQALPWIVDQCRRRSVICVEIPGLDCDSQSWLRIRRQWN